MHGRTNEPGLGVLMLPVSCRGKQPDRLDAQQRHGVAWSHGGPRTTDSVFCDVSCLHGHGRVTGNGIGARRAQTQQLQQLVARVRKQPYPPERVLASWCCP